METRNNKTKLATIIFGASTGNADIILVYHTHTIARIRKLSPNNPRERTSSDMSAGLPASNEAAPTDNANPKMRSESV